MVGLSLELRNPGYREGDMVRSPAQASRQGSGSSWPGGAQEPSCVSLLWTHAPHSSCWM